MTRSQAIAGRRSARRPSRSVPFIIGLCIVAGAMAVALVASILWPKWPGAIATPDAPELPITVGGVTFNVPPSAIRVAVQRRPGTQERIDLNFLWPSLAAPEPAAKQPSSEKPPRPELLFVTIEGATGTLAPTDRLKAIYPRYVHAEAFAGPDGLHGAQFRDGTPYQGEDLFIDSTAPERFTARCTRPGRGDMPGTCLVERRLGAAAITLRFPRDWLPAWRDIAAGTDRLIAGLRPAKG